MVPFWIVNDNDPIAIGLSKPGRGFISNSAHAVQGCRLVVLPPLTVETQLSSLPPKRWLFASGLEWRIGVMTLDSAFSVGSKLTLGTNPTNANFTTSDSGELPVRDRLAQELSVAATQLVEAAYRARAGDCDATRAHVAHAIALLDGIPSLDPRGVRPQSSTERFVERGALPAWQMRKVAVHVEGNISRRIRVQELAELLGLSASHFCRSFKCASGTSPRDYVLRRRIEVAQSMMLTTREPLHSIAADCGMCDQQHFTRSFRRMVGESPTMWRRTRRGLMNVD
jgi:AraC family transcriptional regulator